MSPGDIILVNFPQVVGKPKLRPSLFLSSLPGPYQSILACGISTKLHLIKPDWDEVVQQGNTDFATSGLHQSSVIRLSYLTAIKASEVVGGIGQIDYPRLTRLQSRLSDHLRP